MPLFISYGDKVRDRFRVGLADEFAAALRSSCSRRLAEILDDAVVHDGDEIGGMRMRVVFRRAPMCCPARMTDADRAAERFALQPCFERVQFAFGAATAEHAMIERRDAGGIVAAILETLECIDELTRDRLVSDNSDDPAHPFGWPLYPAPQV